MNLYPMPCTLKELLIIMRDPVGSYQGCIEGPAGGLHWLHLPTFGGDMPDGGQGAWSWDADSAIAGTSAANVRIFTRAELPEYEICLMDGMVRRDPESDSSAAKPEWDIF